MKEGYISFENAKKKTKEWMRILSFFKKKHEDFVFKPKESALLVIDMQSYFIDVVGDVFVPVGKFVLSQTKRLAERYYEKNLPVIFTRYAVYKDEPDDIMNRWWGSVLLVDDPKSLIVNGLDTEKGEVIIKPGYSAFLRTNLDTILERKRVKQVVITGVLTHLCCETTARDAFQRGYEVYFVVDGTGTYDEEIHKASLFNLSQGFVIPVTVEEILGKL